MVDGEHAYEAVMKDGGDKTPQEKRPSAGKGTHEFDLKPCPAYAPVTTQGTGGAKADTLYETVSSM